MKKTYKEIKDPYANDDKRTRRGTQKPMAKKRSERRLKNKVAKMARRRNRWK